MIQPVLKQYEPVAVAGIQSEVTESRIIQFLQNSRRIIARLLKPIIIPEANPRSVSSVSQIPGPFQWPNHPSPSSVLKGCLHTRSSSFSLLIPSSSFSSEAGDPTVTVKELHDKILESVNVKRSMPPNAWLWSLIESCQCQDDINLLFEVLQKLRRFRLSNLGIHDNFNSNLCQQVAKTCVRVGAIDSGKKALWKHNVLGLTPSVASAHHLLSYELEHKNSELMEEVMTLLKTNDLPLQPGTADLVFRICHDTDKWDLQGKYSKRFSKAGVKLRTTTFDVWMDFAANRGTFDCSIEELPVQGFVIESKPEEAAAVIQLICQVILQRCVCLSLCIHDKKSVVSTEFKKLVNEWPVEVIRRQAEEDKKALADSLKSVIPSMVNALLSSGLNVSMDLDELYKKDDLLS
ncbi:BnaC08g10310D [Brassica napus]|uniref:BnaC08g10310D protein n=1 Tax=Brassica napus TaxID=3708 RepID=A0A078F7K2_BRANA|nr:BnaC08g10310D [Brassica napus]